MLKVKYKNVKVKCKSKSIKIKYKNIKPVKVKFWYPKFAPKLALNLGGAGGSHPPFSPAIWQKNEIGGVKCPPNFLPNSFHYSL